MTSLSSVARKLELKLAQTANPTAQLQKLVQDFASLAAEYSEVASHSSSLPADQAALEVARELNNGKVQQLLKTVAQLTASGYWNQPKK
jgi:hypothetical protein